MSTAFHDAHTDASPRLLPAGDCDVCDDIREGEARDDERMRATGCILDHAALKLDPRGWARCRSIGTQPDGDGGMLELRNCWRCGTTLAKAMP